MLFTNGKTRIIKDFVSSKVGNMLRGVTPSTNKVGKHLVIFTTTRMVTTKKQSNPNNGFNIGGSSNTNNNRITNDKNSKSS